MFDVVKNNQLTVAERIKYCSTNQQGVANPTLPGWTREEHTEFCFTKERKSGRWFLLSPSRSWLGLNLSKNGLMCEVRSRYITSGLKSLK